MRIAVLSDTHLPTSIREVGELGGATEELLGGVDLILHAGDVNLPSVLDWCERFAPVRCSLGGHDHFEDARCASVQHVEHAGWRLGMVHDVEAIPRRITTPRQLASEIYGDAGLDVLRAEIVPLGETEGAANPSTAATVVLARGRVIEASVGGRPVETLAWRPPMAPELPV